MPRPALRTERIELRPMTPGHLPHPNNAASIRLADRLGFWRDREETTPWSPAVVYRHDLS